jgi:RimJ/RimL family protein N-acetyltransferase
MQLTLRPATMEDATVLLEWRNDPETRRSSQDADVITLDSHRMWLAGVLQNPARKLLIAENGSTPVGTVRIDHHDTGCELSWTVAPEHRGKGCGKKMVAAAVLLCSGAVFAKIKADNAASIAIARHIGLSAASTTRSGLIVWERTGEP